MRHAVALLAGLLVIAAGCGGSGRLSKDEYLAKADAICTESNAKVRAIPTPKGLLDVQPYLKKVTPLLEQERDRLRTLKAPKADEQTVERLLAKADAVVGAANTFVKQGPSGITALQQGLADARAFTTAARAYGLKACGIELPSLTL